MVNQMAKMNLSLLAKAQGIGWLFELRDRSGAWFYCTRILFHDWGTAIYGDILNVQSKSHRYGMEWFTYEGRPQGHAYLAEKFLGQKSEWSPEECAAILEETYKDEPGSEEWIGDLVTSIRDGAVAGEGVFCYLRDIGAYVSDGIPGYYYPRSDTGWLAAIQARFAQEVVKPEMKELIDRVSGEQFYKKGE